MSPFENEKHRMPFSTWSTALSKYTFSDNLLEDLFVNEDVFCTRIGLLDRFKGKKILIVGGGPSTREFNFSNHNYDSIWSCNHFFLNDKLNRTKVDLTSVAGELNIKDSNFLDYTQRYNPIVCLEIHQKWRHYNLDDCKNYMVFHSNFYGKLGICVRQMIMAAFCGAPEIGFVGLDGPKYIKKGDHAFEKNKNLLPSGYNNEMYFNQYKIFWDYIQKKFPDTVFKNLGYENNYHPV